MGFEVKIRVHSDTLMSAMSKRIKDFKSDMLDDEMRLRAAEIYAEQVKKYVPMKDGDLRSEISYPRYKGTRAVQYDVQYAQAQYTGFNGRGAIMHWTTEGTHDHWNHHMTPSDRNLYYELVKEEILARVNHG